MFVYHFQRVVSYFLIAVCITTAVVLIWQLSVGSKSSSEQYVDLLTYPMKTSFHETTLFKFISAKNFTRRQNLNYNLHIFYYAWYGNPVFDERYMHWNHQILPSWRQKNHTIPLPFHQPPSNIGASFYPKLGPYSSRDVKVVQDHMRQIKNAGVGVVSVSWYPPHQHDDQGTYDPTIMSLIMHQALLFKLKVCLHIEPFKNRSVQTMRQALKYIMATYATHPAFYRYTDPNSGKSLPLYYIYDSYLMDQSSWAKLLRPADSELANEEVTVRGSGLDGFFIGLVVERKHLEALQESGFDGLYTYFGTDTFTYGSNPANWKNIADFAKADNMLFIPSVAPGYNDERIRPWNKMNSRGRRGGDYYEDSFRKALASESPIISITSFNEWHEGTQIEEAVPFQSASFSYLDYSPHKPDHYLTLTHKWAFKFSEKQILLSAS